MDLELNGHGSLRHRNRLGLCLTWTVDGTKKDVHTNLTPRIQIRTARTSAKASPVTRAANWVALTADLSAFAGQTVEIGFRYWTDVAAVGRRVRVRRPGHLRPGRRPSPSDERRDRHQRAGTLRRASAPPPARTRPSRAATTTSPSTAQYRRVTTTASRTGPYNFGFLDNPLLQNWVERLPVPGRPARLVLGHVVTPTTTSAITPVQA